MALSAQTIRKDTTIIVDGQRIPKEELIEISKSWTDIQENFFRKMLHQGGEFKLKGVSYNIKPSEVLLTSRGEKDSGIVTIPGEDSRF
jgi:hypothetical protein